MAENGNVMRFKYMCTCGAPAGIYAKTVYLSSAAAREEASAPSAPSAQLLALRKRYEDSLFENKEEFKRRKQLLEKDQLENLDEKDRIISTLRKITQDLEKQIRELESATGTDGQRSSPSHANTSALQRLLDQIERLQTDKQKLLRLLLEFKVTGSDELIHESPLFQKSTVEGQRSSDEGQADVPNELGTCTTDTEKELEQTIRRKHMLEKEILQLRHENLHLRHQRTNAPVHDANHNYPHVESRLVPHDVQPHVESRLVPHDVQPHATATAVESEDRLAPINGHDLSPTDQPSQERISSLGRQIEELRAELEQKTEEVQQQKMQIDQQMSSQNEDRETAVEEAQNKMASEVARLSASLASLANVASSVYREFQLVKESYLALRDQMVGVPLSLGSYMVQIQKQVKQSLTDLASSNKEIVQKYLREMKLRKKYHNQLVELRGNIRVLCRIRPRITEDGDDDTDLVLATDSQDDGLIKVNFKGRVQSFDMDKVFGLDSTQAQIFDEVSALVRSVIDGFNVCIFAYGQTGSGKTYTMEGSSADPGINQRALQLLFEETKDSSNWQYEISASVLEIYNESIRDLLNPDPNNRMEVKMKQDGGYHVPGLETRVVSSLDEVNQVFSIGRQNRATATTNMNEHSSRSHCLLCVTVKGLNPTTGSTTFGRLNLVDLAGSERVGKSQADGARLKEAQNINRSLACLGDVIHALRSKHNHVPYRNSKLTFLLRDSLGGDSKTMMIVQASPVEKNVAESLCTLAFGQRVKTVELGQATRSADGSHKSSAKKSSSSSSSKKSRPSSLNLSTASSVSRSTSASSANSSHNSSFASNFSSSASSPTFSLNQSGTSSPFFDFSPACSSSAASSPSTTPTCRTPTPLSPSPSPLPHAHSSFTAKKSNTTPSMSTPKPSSLGTSMGRTTSFRKSPSTPSTGNKRGQGLQRSATFTVRGTTSRK